MNNLNFVQHRLLLKAVRHYQAHNVAFHSDTYKDLDEILKLLSKDTIGNSGAIFMQSD